MGYFNEGEPLAGLGSCGPSCACSSCKGGSALSEYYYEGEGRDPPRKGKGGSAVDGLGFPVGFAHGYGLGENSGNVTVPIKIVAKSFIATIGLDAGVPTCGRFDLSAHARLRGAAAATDAAMRESPTSDAKDRRYRLYTSRTFTVTCNNGTIVNVVPSTIDTEVGLECVPATGSRICLTPPPIIVTDVTGGLRTPTRFVFSWMGRGRPPNTAEHFFQAVCPRTSVFIWHRVDGFIECAGGQPRATVTLTGSQFPSHRIWVNGVPQGGPIVQGPFSNLWVPRSSAEPTMVR